MNNYYIKSFRIPLKDLILEITIIKSQILLNNSISKRAIKAYRFYEVRAFLLYHVIFIYHCIKSNKLKNSLIMEDRLYQICGVSA